jgi:hypothetical protein
LRLFSLFPWLQQAVALGSALVLPVFWAIIAGACAFRCPPLRR